MKTKLRLTLSLCICGFAIFTSCRKTRDYNSTAREPSLPSNSYQYNSGFPNEMVTLGRVLFYEVQLSANNTVSCGTCHIQSLGFSDGKKFSTGLADRLTSRNTPGITSESVNRGLFWDSRASSFQELALMPVTNHTEMGVLDAAKLPQKLQNLSYYNELFSKAFGSSEISLERVRQSMGAFLSSLNRPFASKFERSNHSGEGLTVIEQIGSEVFNGKGQCNSCHTLSNFGWRDAANIGLELDYTDKGMGLRQDFGSPETMEGVFRIPNLFNIELTAPYMHDGRFTTLEQVVEHYNSGIKPHRNLDWRLRATEELKGQQITTGKPLVLNLTAVEKKGLVAFLKTLTDWEYVNDPRFNNPFIH
jgi:cytochrome c peroxidase